MYGIYLTGFNVSLLTLTDLSVNVCYFQQTLNK